MDIASLAYSNMARDLQNQTQRMNDQFLQNQMANQIARNNEQYRQSIEWFRNNNRIMEESMKATYIKNHPVPQTEKTPLRSENTSYRIIPYKPAPRQMKMQSWPFFFFILSFALTLSGILLVTISPDYSLITVYISFIIIGLSGMIVSYTRR